MGLNSQSSLYALIKYIIVLLYKDKTGAIIWYFWEFSQIQILSLIHCLQLLSKSVGVDFYGKGILGYWLWSFAINSSFESCYWGKLLSYTAPIGRFHKYTWLITFKAPPCCRKKGESKGAHECAKSLCVVLQVGCFNICLAWLFCSLNRCYT